MDENGITFKATVNGLILIMKEEDSFEAVVEQIGRKLDTAGKFFKGASITIRYRGKKLTKQEEEKLAELIALKTGAEIRSFEEDTSEAEKDQNDETEEAHQKTKLRKLYFKGINEGNTKFFRGTVRSGQLVSFDGNIVVIGDVNPGGVVEALGNVIVVGSLRGVVHAGADGNKEAVVVALNLQPTQLRIADVITRSPDEEGLRSSAVPELAFVRDDMVYIERFLPQYK
jgi:septum site-determining protein MinC